MLARSQFSYIALPDEQRLPDLILNELLAIQNTIEGKTSNEQKLVAPPKKLHENPKALATEKLTRTKAILTEQLTQFQQATVALSQLQENKLARQVNQFSQLIGMPCSCNTPSCKNNSNHLIVSYQVFRSAQNAANDLYKNILELSKVKENQTQETLEHYIQITQSARAVLSETTPENINHLIKLASHRVNLNKQPYQYELTDERHKPRKLVGAMYTLAGIAGFCLCAAAVILSPLLLFSACVWAAIGLVGFASITGVASIAALQKGSTLFNGMRKTPEKKFIENFGSKYETANKAETSLSRLN